MIKKLWAIADSPKTDSKEKIKAIVLIGQHYRERLELVGDEKSMNQKVQYIEDYRRSSPYRKQI